MTDRDCHHGTLARQCDRCEMEGEVERLRAFVAAFDAWREGGLWPDADVSKMLRDAMMAAREAVGAIEPRP